MALEGLILGKKGRVKRGTRYAGGQAGLGHNLFPIFRSRACGRVAAQGASKKDLTALFCFDLEGLPAHKFPQAPELAYQLMRLATILPRASLEPVAVASAPDGTWVELAALTGRHFCRVEEGLTWVIAHLEHLEERAAAWKGPRYRCSEFEFLPPIPRPAAFRDFDAFELHVKNCRARQGLELSPEWYTSPAFYFANRLALVGQGAEVCAPCGSHELDFGLALGVVIGKRGRNIPLDRAWEHVAGFTVVNDLAARDLERRALSTGMGPVKGKDFATAVGPWLTLRSAVEDRILGDKISLSMAVRVNGRELSRGDSASLYHSIPSLIVQASLDAELFPGDLLSTGAVGGGCLWELGANGEGWLAPGDVVELEIERLGTLLTHIVSRTCR